MNYRKNISRGTDSFYYPSLKASDKYVMVQAFSKAKRIYGNLPDIVRKQLKWEINAICQHNFSVIYTALGKIAKTAKKRGYPVSSSGCSASSFVAYLLGITEINPLPPHYICPNCRYSDFESGVHCNTGCDLPDKNCPVCGQKLNKDGFNLSVETLLGIDGDKLPDIGLRFPENYVSLAAEHLEEIFGEGTVCHIERGNDRCKNAFFIIHQGEDVTELSFEELENHFLKFDLSGDSLLSKLWKLEHTTRVELNSIKKEGNNILQRISGGAEMPITTRDDVFQLLIKKGLSRQEAYKYMRIITLGGIKRKASFVEDWRNIAKKFGIPTDYVDAIEQLDYLPSKTDEIVCAVENYQLFWYREHYPKEYFEIMEDLNFDREPGPALFFCVDDGILFHSCAISKGEQYGDFINYPQSHYDIWTQNYEQKYGVDFDYYPRGRIVYRKTDDTFLIYYDKCMEAHLSKVIENFQNRRYELNLDEHYQCHICNKEYVI